MKTWFGISSLALALALLLAVPTHAADPPVKSGKSAAWHKQLADQFDKGTRWAVLIGIDKYKPPLSPLKCCVNDVKLLTETLAKNCGYDRERIIAITDSDATKANIQKRLTDVLKQVKPNDTVLVAFGGHGGLFDGQSIFSTIDQDVGNPKLTGLRFDDVRTMLHDCKAAQKILVIDSCHSGGGKVFGTAEPDAQQMAGPFKRASGLISFASARRNQTALDYNGHGVFTAHFARGLAGEADFDNNGIVDSDEIYRHLLLEVPAGAKLVDPKHEQTPVRIIGEDVVGVFALSRPSGVVNGVVPKVEAKVPIRPKGGDTVTNAVGMKFVYLPPGPVIVGSPNKEYLRNDDEAEQLVAITRPIYMGAFEVTQAEYAKVMGKHPSYFSAKGDGADAVAKLDTGRFPVEQVSWDDAVAFCEKLSAMPEERKARRAYRLPTEAEWEYACRAGTWTVFHTGNRLSPKQANIRGDRPYLDSEEGPALGRTTAVGSYKPNAFGLYDMHGNVAEWCSDYYTARRFAGRGTIPTPKAEELKDIAVFLAAVDALDSAADKQKVFNHLGFPHDPLGPNEGDTRVFRGGSYTGDVAFCRSACRRDKDPAYKYRGLGFRVVCYPVIDPLPKEK